MCVFFFYGLNFEGREIEKEKRDGWPVMNDDYKCNGMGFPQLYVRTCTLLSSLLTQICGEKNSFVATN